MMSIRRAVSGASALAIAAACGGAASGTTIVFDLSNGGGYNYQWDSSFSVTSGGYTLTFSNPGGAAHQNTTPGGGYEARAPNNQFAFERDTDGLLIGNYWSVSGTGEAFPGYTSSFTMTLSGPTNLLFNSYNVEYVTTSSGGWGPAQPFTLSRNGTTLSASNSLASTGTFNLAGGPLLWVPGQSLDFNAAGTNEYDLSQIRYLTFEVTSIPGAGVVSLSTIGLAAVSRRRRR